MKKLILTTLFLLVISLMCCSIVTNVNEYSEIAFAEVSYEDFGSDWKTNFNNAVGFSANQITSIVFDSDIPSNYTDKWGESEPYSYYNLTSSSSIKICHKNGSNFDIAFVAENKVISAPSDSTELFSFYTVESGNTVYSSSLINLNIQNLYTSNVSKMDSMFRGLKGVSSLDLSNLDMSSVTSCENMLSGINSSIIYAPKNIQNTIAISLDTKYYDDNNKKFVDEIDSTNCSDEGVSNFYRGYTITWNNYDDQKLSESLVAYGSMPKYERDTPKRPGTSTKIYRFSGWTTTIKTAAADTTYTAKFDLADATMPSEGSWLTKFEALSSKKRTDLTSIIFSTSCPTGYISETDKYVDDDFSIQLAYCDADPNKIALVCQSYIYAPENCNNMFNGCENLKYLDLSCLIMTNTNTVEHMFKNTFPNEIIAPLGGVVSIPLPSTYKASSNSSYSNVEISSLYRSSLVNNVLKTVKYERTIKHVWYVDDVLYEELIFLYNRSDKGVADPTKESSIQYDYTFVGWNNVVKDNDYIKDNAIFTQSLRKYTIKFLNGNGTIIYSNQFEYGTMPQFSGETPTKSSDEYYSYTFKCWNIEIQPVTSDYTYVPLFNESILDYEVEVPFWGYIIIGVGLGLIVISILIAIFFRARKRLNKARRDKIFNSEDDDDLLSDDDNTEDYTDDFIDDSNSQENDDDLDFDELLDDDYLDFNDADAPITEENDYPVDNSEFLSADDLLGSNEDIEQVDNNQEETINEEEFLSEEDLLDETLEEEQEEELDNSVNEEIEDNNEIDSEEDISQDNAEEARTKLDEFFDSISSSNTNEESIGINQPTQKKKTEAPTLTDAEILAIREHLAETAKEKEIEDDDSDEVAEVEIPKESRFKLLPMLIDVVLNSEVVPSKKSLKKYASVLMDLYYKYTMPEDRKILEISIVKIVDKMGENK